MKLAINRLLNDDTPRGWNTFNENQKRILRRLRNAVQGNDTDTIIRILSNPNGIPVNPF